MIMILHMLKVLLGVFGVVWGLLEEAESDLSSFSEFDDTDEDNIYMPSNLSGDNQSSNGKYNYYIIFLLLYLIIHRY